MLHRSELINYIAKKIDAKTYLEIGTFNREHNFNKVEIEKKLCVDPDPAAKADFLGTSDEFFAQNKEFFWMGFIDGLHDQAQFKRDLINTYLKIEDGGVIVMHDCNPLKESITHYPRDSREWCGNIYQIICQIASPKFTVDMDYGCCVIRKSPVHPLIIQERYISYQYFDMNREHLLNLVSVEEAKTKIDNWYHYAD